MKLVTAVVKPHKWEDVRVALESVGVKGMTAARVNGNARRKAPGGVNGVLGYAFARFRKIRIGTVWADNDAGTALEGITSSEQTGKSGDGKVWVSAVDSVVRVRTGERDEAAL